MRTRAMHRTIAAGVLLCASASTAWAGKEAAVAKLLDQDRAGEAQAKCTRLGAQYSTASKELREVCAKAFLPAAEETNTAVGWLQYQQSWKGTSYEATGREREAGAALTALGDTAAEHQYANFMRTYEDTKLVGVAEKLMIEAAFREAETGKDALRVATAYPSHPRMPELVGRFLPYFVKVEISGDAITPRLDPPVDIGLTEIVTGWAARLEGGEVVDWEVAAERSLTDLGMGAPTVAGLQARRTGGFPKCQVPGTNWQLGVEIRMIGGTAFLPQPSETACGAESWPAFMVVANGRIAALSAGPMHTLRFPTDPAVNWFEWGDAKTRIYLPTAAQEPGVVALGVAQPVGQVYLIHPLGGGMPWYGSVGAAEGYTALPAEMTSTALPAGWGLLDSGNPLPLGSQSAGPIRVTHGSLGTSEWTIPAGEARVLSPIVQVLAGLYRSNPLLTLDRATPLPKLTSAVGPPGSVQIALEELDRQDRNLTAGSVQSLGFGLAVDRAWRINLNNTGPPETVFEGRVGTQPVKGVFDMAAPGGGAGLMVFLRDHRAQSGPETVFGFLHQERVYVAWSGKGPDGPYAETLHFENTGLIREFK